MRGRKEVKGREIEWGKCQRTGKGREKIRNGENEFGKR